MTYQFEEAENSFILKDDNNNQVGEVTYSRAGEKLLIIDHTGVNDDHRGQGLAEQLVLKVVEKAKNEGLKIMPLCPFAKLEFERKEAYREVQH